MTEQQAKDYLYDLWETGEISSNFNEDHSDYYKAVNYTVENGEFNYEDFYNNMVVINFGEWQVESDALVHKFNKDYIIQDSRFWEFRDYNGHLVWDWLIHLTEKAWVNSENIKDLNNAFFFCQDYFKKFKPSDIPYISTAQTLNIQKQLMEIRDEMAKSEKPDKYGVVDVGNEDMLKYRRLVNNVSYL